MNGKSGGPTGRKTSPVYGTCQHLMELTLPQMIHRHRATAGGPNTTHAHRPQEGIRTGKHSKCPDRALSRLISSKTLQFPQSLCFGYLPAPHPSPLVVNHRVEPAGWRG